KRVAALVSVEHDPDWHERVSGMLAREKLTNAEVRLAPESQYLKAASGFAEGSLDVISIDGLVRGRALGASLSRLRQGGLLVFNHAHLYLPSGSETPHARSREDGPEASIDPAVFVELQRWRVKWLSDGTSDTALFYKP